MDWTKMIFSAVGGLALFLYGMGMMSDGLKMAAGDSMRALLAKITKWPVMAMLVGAGVTAVIQSSSATSVIVIGLINAGLLTLKQAICVILGANIGTTITGWLAALISGMEAMKITQYAMPMIAVGLLITFVGKRQRTKNMGSILLGLGILFLGLGFLSQAFAVLKSPTHSPARDLLASIGGSPILAVLAAATFTMIIQSSSATVTMIIFLAIGTGTESGIGAFGAPHEALRAAIPFVLGANIGTTVTAWMAALRTNLAGKRTAMAHTLFNVIGVLIVLPVTYTGHFADFVEFVSPVALTKGSLGPHIAIAHTMFNISAAVVMLPFIGVLERLVIRILPTRQKDIDDQPVTLEVHLLDTPPLALDQARREMLRMGAVARDTLNDAFIAILENNPAKVEEVARQEDTIDNFQREITTYLVELSQRKLARAQASMFPVLLHGVNDIERIGDHAKNIAESAERKMRQGDTFSPEAEAEITRMRHEVNQMFDDVMFAVEDSDVHIARRALTHEKLINQMQVDLRKRHVARLTEGNCTAMSGMVFVDLVDNIEKIGDHLANVAQGVLHGMQWGTEDDDEGQDTDASDQ